MLIILNDCNTRTGALSIWRGSDADPVLDQNPFQVLTQWRSRCHNNIFRQEIANYGVIYFFFMYYSVKTVVLNYRLFGEIKYSFKYSLLYCFLSRTKSHGHSLILAANLIWNYINLNIHNWSVWNNKHISLNISFSLTRYSYQIVKWNLFRFYTYLLYTCILPILYIRSTILYA